MLNPITSGEIERRWQCLRDIMADRSVDVLVSQSNNAFHGGYLRWLTGTPARHGGPVTVLFPREEPMRIVRRGIRSVTEIGATDPANRGVARVHRVPSNPACSQTSLYNAVATVSELAPWQRSRIGLLGPQTMGYTFLHHVKTTLPFAEFLDITLEVDRVKATKSPEEINHIRQIAAIQDAVFRAVSGAVEPGKIEYEITALARYEGEIRGCEQGIFLIASGAPDSCPAPKMHHHQGRILREGDLVSLLIENNGPSGYYAELARSFILGRPPEALLAEHEVILTGQVRTLERLAPGADPLEILADQESYLHARGRDAAYFMSAHGQGYDMVERPTITSDETLRIGKNMTFAVHPNTLVDGRFYSFSDSFLINERGQVERLHQTPQKLFEL